MRAGKEGEAARLVSGTFWALAGTVVARALTVSGTFLYARFLGPVAFGEYAIAQATVSAVAVIAGMGAGLTATKFTAEFRKRDPAALAAVLSTCRLVSFTGGLALTGLLILFAYPIASGVLGRADLTPLIMIAALALFFGSLDGYYSGVLFGHGAFKEHAVSLIVAAVVSVPFGVAIVYSFGTVGGAWAIVVSSASQCVAAKLALAGIGANTDRFETAGRVPIRWGVVVHSCVPAMLAGVLVPPAHWVCYSLLLHQRDGAIQLGLLALSVQWFQIIQLVPAAGGKALLPLLTSSIASEDRSAPRRALGIALTGGVLIAAPLVVFVAWFSNEIMAFYGPEFAAGAPVLVAMTIAGGLLAIQTSVGNLVSASGRFWTGFGMNVVWVTAYLGSTFVLVDRGALGLAIALVIAYCVHSVWTFAFAFRWLRVREQASLMRPSVV